MNGAAPDCGSLLPLERGSPAAGSVSAAGQAEALPRLRSLRALKHVLLPFRQQGWLRRAAAGCRSPGVVALALLFISTSILAAPVDILTNGGFEGPYTAFTGASNATNVITGVRPTGWQDNSLTGTSKTDTVWAEETVGTVSGSALKITAAVFSGQSSGASIQAFQNVPSVSGRSYTASIWLKGSQSGTAVLRLRQAASPFTVRATVNCAVTTVWTQFTLSLNATVNETLRLDVQLDNQPMTLWMDEASLAVADGNRHWYVSPSGLDTNDGSIGSPFLTLARAMQSVVAGDTL